MSCHGGEDWYILLFWGKYHGRESERHPAEAERSPFDHSGHHLADLRIPVVDHLRRIIGFILAISATVSGNNCKKQGGTIAGFVMGVLGIIFNAVGFIACVACTGALATFSMM